MHSADSGHPADKVPQLRLGKIIIAETAARDPLVVFVTSVLTPSIPHRLDVWKKDEIAHSSEEHSQNAQHAGHSIHVPGRTTEFDRCHGLRLSTTGLIDVV